MRWRARQHFPQFDSWISQWVGGFGQRRHLSSKTLREPSLEELAQLRSRLELEDWIRFFEGGSENGQPLNSLLTGEYTA
jgi:hypothetical protein